MKSRFRKIIEWKNRILIDGVSATGESVVVLFLSSLSLIILGINYGLDTKNISFFDAFLIPITSALRPTEMIIYVTGILSSTTAYFIFRISALRSHIVRVVCILLLACVLFWASTPLFIAGLEKTPENPEFATTLAKGLGIFALLLWWFSLFSQRRILEKSATVSGDRRGREIAKNLEDFHNGKL